MTHPVISRQQASDAASAAATFTRRALMLRAKPQRTSAERHELGRALRRRDEIATIAYRYAERMSGYREARISLDGLLLVCVAAKAAGFYRPDGAWRVLVEYAPDPRALAFRTGK